MIHAYQAGPGRRQTVENENEQYILPLSNLYQRLSSDKVNFGDWSSGKIVLYPFFRYVKFRTGKVTYKIDIIDI